MHSQRLLTPECGPARRALMRLCAGVCDQMLAEIACVHKRLTAQLAHKRPLSGVYPLMSHERRVIHELFATLGACMGFEVGVQAPFMQRARIRHAELLTTDVARKRFLAGVNQDVTA